MIPDNKKTIVGILFGGKSAEHEVSLQSAKNIYDAIDRDKFEPVLIGIDKGGKWLLSDASRFLLNFDNPRHISLDPSGSPTALIPASQGSLLGNDAPIVLVPGEVIPAHEFYSYEAKYLDENGASLEIPAKLDSKTQKRIQELSIKTFQTKTFQTLCCAGLSRIDFFLKENSEVLINEINTMPGFTKNSMYPKLWEADGIGYTELISRLIELAMEKQ